MYAGNCLACKSMWRPWAPPCSAYAVEAAPAANSKVVVNDFILVDMVNWILLKECMVVLKE